MGGLTCRSLGWAGGSLVHRPGRGSISVNLKMCVRDTRQDSCGQQCFRRTMTSARLFFRSSYEFHLVL